MRRRARRRRRLARRCSRCDDAQQHGVRHGRAQAEAASKHRSVRRMGARALFTIGDSFEKMKVPGRTREKEFSWANRKRVKSSKKQNSLSSFSPGSPSSSLGALEIPEAAVQTTALFALSNQERALLHARRSWGRKNADDEIAEDDKDADSLLDDDVAALTRRRVQAHAEQRQQQDDDCDDDICLPRALSEQQQL